MAMITNIHFGETILRIGIDDGIKIFNDIKFLSCCVAGSIPALGTKKTFDT
jgi:hypothetical protein